MAYEFSCHDAGAVTCGAKVSAGSEEELRAVLVEHLAAKHKVSAPNETLLDHLVASARRDGQAPG